MINSVGIICIRFRAPFPLSHMVGMLVKAVYICREPITAGMKKNILLVDDDKIFNFLSEKTITSLGLANEISFASNGQQALEVLELYRTGKMQMPDIIFLDLDMPIMNGYEACKAIRARPGGAFR